MTKAFDLGQHLHRSMVNAKDFGAVGDGVADDWAAIQAAAAKAAQGGGGSWVFLPPTSGGYRITQGLKLPSYVGICGASPSRYPFAAGAPNVSQIIADFADPNQWVIEPATTLGGAAIGYNTIIKPSDVIGRTYNCAVKDLIISSVNALPYGGIRMHGCPGATVRDVAINRVGCGLLANGVYNGEFQAHCLAAYYGAVIWSDCNANKLDIYAARDQAYTGVVPAGYIMPFLASLNTTLTTFYNLSTNEHYNRAWGVIIGAPDLETVQGNCGELLAERFSGGVMMLNTGSTKINRLYVEGDAVHTALAASHSRFQVDAFHTYLNGAGQAIDMGDRLTGIIHFGGIVFVGALGKLPKLDNTSKLLLYEIGFNFKGTTPNQYNVWYPDSDGAWITPTVTGPVTLPTGGATEDFAFRITRDNNIVFRGFLSNFPAPPFVAFVLPPGYRPDKVQYLWAGTGKEWVIEPNGNVSNTVGTGNLNGNGVSFVQVG